MISSILAAASFLSPVLIALCALDQSILRVPRNKYWYCPHVPDEDTEPQFSDTIHRVRIGIQAA